MDFDSIPKSVRDEHGGRMGAALQLAVLAGDSTLEFFQKSSTEVEIKGDNSPVTIADKNAEQKIRAQLETLFPDDAILGEEFGEQGGSTEYQWIVDPIDGTKSFISGVPLYSTLVGVVTQGKCVAGVVYIPGMKEMVCAAVGSGCWHSQGAGFAKCQVSKKPLDRGLFVVSQVDSFAQHGAGEGYLNVEREAFITRSWGDGYGYLLVATGRAEVMVDPIANPWDLAAVQPVVEEAGGKFTCWDGKPSVFEGNGIGSNGFVHDRVLELLRG